jgi:dolichol-phosphate mannosyltransferase
LEKLVIIPTYNEIENIEKMIRTVFDLPRLIEILIVDDASKDKHRIEELISKYHKYNITLFRFEKKERIITIIIIE